MDEIKETNQDTSTKDSSGGSEETTPKTEKTFTEEEVQKRIGDTLAAKGRDAKRLAEQETAIKAQTEANKAASIEIERQRLEAQGKEIEALSDDPEAKRALLRSYDLDKRERELNERDKANQEAVQRMFNEAEALAAEHNLKPSDLLTAGTPEEMKLLAKNLALQRELETKQTKAKEGFPTPDSGTSDAAPSDFKQLQKNFIADPWKYGKAYKQALAKRGQ